MPRSAVGSADVMIGYRYVTPSVIYIRYKLRSARIIYRYYISLQVFLKQICIERALSHAVCTVLHSYRRTRLVIEVYYKYVAKLFCQYLRAVQRIIMCRAGYCLARSYPLGHRRNISAAPDKFF